MALAHCDGYPGLSTQLRSQKLRHNRSCMGARCPMAARGAQWLPQQHLTRRQLLPRAAASADTPSGIASGLPKLPPIRRIRLPAPAVDSKSDEPPVDVDSELWELLDLCSVEELEELHGILFGASPLSPLVKSIVMDSEPAAAHLRGRDSLMRRIESRFRFLAADATATLKGQRPSYRQSLLAVRQRLEVQCPSTMSTQDLETEIFLHMMKMYADSTEQASKQEVDAFANAFAVDSDGMAPPRRRFGGPGWAQALEQLAAPLKLGSVDLMPLLAKFTSAVSMSSVRNATLQKLGVSLLRSRVQYEAAFYAACRGAASTASSAATRQAALHASQQGLTTAAARYGVARGMLSVLGPAMWAFFAGELALKSIGTDYGRVVRSIYTLAQIRMVRTHGWSSPQRG